MHAYLQTFAQPFRLVFDACTCILCGRERGRMAKAKDSCKCLSMSYCKACKTDNEYAIIVFLYYTFDRRT